MVTFKYTILYVNDVTSSITFYENAFGFTRKFITPENDYGELLTGDTTIAFASIQLADSNLKNGFTPSSLKEKSFGIELGFVTDNVAASVEQALQHGATLESAPIEKPWGQTVAYIRDINGFLIELCTAMA